MHGTIGNRIGAFAVWIAGGLLALPGCGGSASPADRPEPPPPASGAPADSAARAEAERAEMEARFWARRDEVRSRYTEADVRFMQRMIGHHAQALVMADLVPGRTERSSLHTLAARIANAQRDEIALMQRWLRDRDESAPELHGEGASLTVHGAHVSHEMPGMLDEDQMSRLAAARGLDFDRRFLACMIEHHRGAVVMVHELFAADGAAQDPAVFRLASDIQVDQNTEIARMERMLLALPGAEATC